MNEATGAPARQDAGGATGEAAQFAAPRADASSPVADALTRRPELRRALHQGLFRHKRAMARAVTLIAATALSLFGTIGQFVLVDGAEDLARARIEEMQAIETRTETLRTAQSAYFNAQVQANMLFALNPGDRSFNKGVIGDLYQLAMHDRAFPFRSILGELAIAGAIDFSTVNGQYNALREKAQTDFSYESFSAVGAFENKVIDDAMALHGRLQDRFWSAQAEKTAAEAIADSRRGLLVGITGIATCLFLIASLMTVKD